MLILAKASSANYYGDYTFQELVDEEISFIQDKMNLCKKGLSGWTQKLRMVNKQMQAVVMNADSGQQSGTVNDEYSIETDKMDLSMKIADCYVLMEDGLKKGFGEDIDMRNAQGEGQQGRCGNYLE
jgi:hypothetical protein